MYINPCLNCLVVEPGCPAWKRIKSEFGKEVLNVDSSLNREKLGEVIFSNEHKRKLLNSITHPEIRKEILRQVLRNFITGEMKSQLLPCN